MAYLGDIQLKQNAPDRALPLLNQATQLQNDIRIAYLDIGDILASRAG